MSDVRAKTIRELTEGSPTRNLLADRLHPWLMYGFQIVLMVMMLIPLMTRQRPNEGFFAIVMLGSAWSILITIHQRQQNRISNLERRLTELESLRLNGQ